MDDTTRVAFRPNMFPFEGKKVKLEEETTGMRAHTIACLLKTYLRGGSH